MGVYKYVLQIAAIITVQRHRPPQSGGDKTVYPIPVKGALHPAHMYPIGTVKRRSVIHSLSLDMVFIRGKNYFNGVFSRMQHFGSIKTMRNLSVLSSGKKSSVDFDFRISIQSAKFQHAVIQRQAGI